MKFRSSWNHKAYQQAAPHTFETFEIVFERREHSFRATVSRSPAGEGGPIDIRPQDLGLAEDGDIEIGDVAPLPLTVNHRKLGEQLFRALLQGELAAQFRTSLAQVRERSIGLRLRLRFDQAPELVNLPWEVLYDPKQRAFLGVFSDISIVRAVKSSSRPRRHGRLRLPVRLVGLIPRIDDTSELSGGQEWDDIKRLLEAQISARTVVAERLEPASSSALGRRIDEDRIDILHVVTHGRAGDRGDNGRLQLEDEDGRAAWVSGSELASALERPHKPRLVVLNACHGARVVFDDALDGLAQHLLSRGVPAVVAMSTAISNRAAVKFAVALYGGLADGLSVESAFAEARRELSMGKSRDEWATPVLYTYGSNDRIFNPWAPRIAKMALVAALLGVLAAVTFLWPKQSPSPCPPMQGFEELGWVYIAPGSLKLDDRLLTVSDGFCIGTHEVTRELWRDIMGEDEDAASEADERYLKWPVTSIDIDAAQGFVERLNVREPGAVYGLPTATEWEYAARAGTTTSYFFGDDARLLEHYGNCYNPLGKDCADGQAVVGSYQPNAWGLYDVHGNASEWVLWPPDSVPELDDEGGETVLRLGGDFRTKPAKCSFDEHSRAVKAGHVHEETGFRIVRRNLAEPPSTDD